MTLKRTEQRTRDFRQIVVDALTDQSFVEGWECYRNGTHCAEYDSWTIRSQYLYESGRFLSSVLLNYTLDQLVTQCKADDELPYDLLDLATSIEPRGHVLGI